MFDFKRDLDLTILTRINYCFWLQGYTDEPISKILSSMGEAEPVLLDRWELQVEKNPDAPPSGDDSGSHHPSRDTLPLSVVNNYFSFGVDAQIALDFHEARGK